MIHHTATPGTAMRHLKAGVTREGQAWTEVRGSAGGVGGLGAVVRSILTVRFISQSGKSVVCRQTEN